MRGGDAALPRPLPARASLIGQGVRLRIAGVRLPVWGERTRFRASRRIWVAESVEQTWRRLVDVDAYERWWPWLTLRGDRRLVPGSSMQASVRSPLGYRVNFAATPTAVVAGSSIDAEVSGDIVGGGWLRLVPAEPPSGVWIDVGWDVRVVRASFRMVAPLARPVLEWGHNRVVDRAINQFGAVSVDEPSRTRGRPLVPAAAVIALLIAALACRRWPVAGRRRR